MTPATNLQIVTEGHCVPRSPMSSKIASPSGTASSSSVASPTLIHPLSPSALKVWLGQIGDAFVEALGPRSFGLTAILGLWIGGALGVVRCGIYSGILRLDPPSLMALGQHLLVGWAAATVALFVLNLYVAACVRGSVRALQRRRRYRAVRVSRSLLATNRRDSVDAQGASPRIAMVG